MCLVWYFPHSCITASSLHLLLGSAKNVFAYGPDIQKKTHFSLLTGLNRTENTENIYTVSFHPRSQVWGRWGVYYHTLLINISRFLPSQINLNICNQIQLAGAQLCRFGRNLEKMISPTCSQKGRHESNVVTLQINL